jgi:hypothetical protein
MAAVSTDAGLLRTVKWASERYRELTSQARFKHLRQMGELTIPAPLTTGTGSITPGSATVVGDATASPVWTSDLIGRHFRAQRNWYQIIDVLPSATAAQLILASVYAESGLGTTGYKIVQRFTKMPPNLRFMGEFVHMRLGRHLPIRSSLAAARSNPSRRLVAFGPAFVVDVGADPESARRLVEFYPYPTQREQVVFTWYPISRDLRRSDVLPNEVDVALMKAGVLIDIYRYEMAKSQRAGSVEAAGLWRNEVRAQETYWDKKMEDMIRNDRATDDLTFLLNLRTEATVAGDTRLWFIPGSEPGSDTTGSEQGWGGGGW